VLEIRSAVSHSDTWQAIPKIARGLEPAAHNGGPQKEDLAPFRLPTTCPASPYQQGGRLRPDRVAAFDRNRWPLSVGIGGRFASDSAPVPLSKPSRSPKSPRPECAIRTSLGVCAAQETVRAQDAFRTASSVPASVGFLLASRQAHLLPVNSRPRVGA